MAYFWPPDRKRPATCRSSHRIWDGDFTGQWGRCLPVVDAWIWSRADRHITASDSEGGEETVSGWQESGLAADSEGEEADKEVGHQEEGTLDKDGRETSSTSEDDESSEDYGKTAWHRRPKLLVWASPRIPLLTKTVMARPAEVNK